MNEIEKQPKLGTGVEQVREVLPPTSVEELNPPQEPVASEGLTPPVSVEAETDVSPTGERTEPKLSYGFPLEQNSNEENPANMVAEKIQGLPPRE